MSDRRKCPHLGGKTCIAEKCAAWATDILIENGKEKPWSDCTEFFWKPLYMKAIIGRAEGTQRAVESFRNNVDANNKATLSVLSLFAHKRPEKLIS